MYLPNNNYKRKKFKQQMVLFLMGMDSVENGEWETIRQGVEGIHRSHETGFLTGPDFVQWKDNANPYKAHFQMNMFTAER